MHYYQFNLSDYITATAHLTPIQDIAYRRLLDFYYEKEKPIPNETEWVSNRIRLASDKDSVEHVLDEFFTLNGDNEWVHDVCDANIAAYQKRCKTNKANSVKGGRPKKTDSVSTRIPNQEPLTNNHKPKDQTLTSSPKVSDPVPFQDIVNLYHEKLPELPKCEILNAKRKGYIRQRWQDKEHGLHTLEHWENFFSHVRKSDFLMGKSQSNNGRQPFRANLEWITNLNNYTKIYEDKYPGQ
jgi:uncharacterized protein YdaU (DUF1376 family)